MNLQDLESKYKELGAEIERLRAKPTGVWEPEVGEDYWAVDHASTVVQWTRGRNSGSNYAFLSFKARHNIYKTKELAEKAGVLQCRSNLVIQACLNVDPDFEPDWSDHNQVKYGFVYDHSHARWEAEATYCSATFGAYVSTNKKYKQVLEYLNSQEVK